MPLGQWLAIYLKKIFMRKKKINVLTAFSIFRKSDVKTFIKLIVNHYLKSTRWHNPYFLIESRLSLAMPSILASFFVMPSILAS